MVGLDKLAIVKMATLRTVERVIMAGLRDAAKRPGKVLVLGMMGRQASGLDKANGVETVDLYSFDEVNLHDYSGLVISGSCDQVYLSRRAERLTSWVKAGGRLLVNGHPLAPMVEGIPQIRKLEFHGLDDVWLTSVGVHPIWRGIELTDVLLRTGVPGEHSFEELKEIGVAGFYARNYLAGLPDGARVITGLGPNRLPVDVAYPLGRGEVVVHAGNDLAGFASEHKGVSTDRLEGNIVEFLSGLTPSPLVRADGGVEDSGVGA